MVVFEYTQPLCVVDPVFRLDSFKVRTLHEEGLRPDGSKLLATCAYANVLSELSVQGQILGDPLGDGLYEYLCQLCKGDPLQVLQGLGYGQVFPHLIRILEEDTASAYPKGSELETHLNYVTSLNSLVRMSTQLHKDADVPANHKYTAHQIALLYQCINHVRGEARQFKKKIEEHFDEIKTITEASSTPELPLDKRQWLKGLTKNIKETVGQFPPQISQHLAPTTAALRKSRGITGMGVSAGASGAAEGWWGSAAAAGAGKGGPASSAVAAAPVAAKGGAAGGYYYGTAGGYQQQQGGWR